MDRSPTYLDGNALAGPLGELVGFEISTAVGQCAGCGRTMALADGHLYARGPGLVLRCGACDNVLLRAVITPQRSWLDMSGVASLQVAGADQQ